jgi:predicted component of type VI protein secretion system
MTELFLEFTTESGEARRVSVSGDKCIVGRHSDSDIAIVDGRVSRCHLKIDRVSDIFVVSDAGSSNGTMLNGRRLNDPVALKKGDVLDLGGLKVNIVLESVEPKPEFQQELSPEVDAPSTPAATSDNGISVSSQPQASGGSSSFLLWILIPVFGLVFIVFAGVIVFLLVSGPKSTVAKKQNDPVYSDDDFDTDNKNKKSSNKKESGNSETTTTNGSPSSTGTTSTDTPSGSSTTTTANQGETAKIEQNGGSFLRNVAQNNPNAFLTTEQASKISSKIKQFSGSSAVAANLDSAKENSSKIAALAHSNGLKPQFLAIAAIAKLGSSKGNVLQTATEIVPVLKELAVTIGNERADDVLIVVAAYDQGVAGDKLKMRNMLQDLANKSPESARAIRTIWYLQKNSKITQAEYESALNFLAIGTISQNPKDFGMSAEPLSF